MADLPENIRDLLDYNPESGVFTWKQKVGRGLSVSMPGAVAGKKNWSGYILIHFRRKAYRAHLIAYEITNGFIPERMEIDHINGIRDDNRISNLGLATRQQNSANSRRAVTNKSGYKGVHRHSNGRHWAVQIMVDQKPIHLGIFRSVEEARAAYISAARQHFGEFARAN